MQEPSQSQFDEGIHRSMDLFKRFFSNEILPLQLLRNFGLSLVDLPEAPGGHADPAEVLHGVTEMSELPVEHGADAGAGDPALLLKAGKEFRAAAEAFARTSLGKVLAIRWTDWQDSGMWRDRLGRPMRGKAVQGPAGSESVKAVKIGNGCQMW